MSTHFSRHTSHRVSLLASVAFSLAASLLATSPAGADPLPNETLKFNQVPLAGIPGTNAFPGHDEVSTAYGVPNPLNGQILNWTGDYMADDFADKFSTPVTHVSWWGSYINNARLNGVQQFLITFESDVPATAGVASHPGTPLLSQIVTLGPIAPASGTFIENPVPTSSTAELLYHYNAELANPFPQKPDTVYWLKIVALTADPNLVWGWHDRDYSIMDPLASTPPAVVPGETNLGTAAFPIWHFQDDAVTGRVVITPTSAAGLLVDQTSYSPTHYVDGLDGPTGISQFSKDLAFQLYTVVPEPSMAALSLLALPFLRRRR